MEKKLTAVTGEAVPDGFSEVGAADAETVAAPPPPRFCVECHQRLNSYNARITNKCCACTWRLMDGHIAV
jgi:hypothetical protein